MSKDSFGRTLLHDSGFLMCTSWTSGLQFDSKVFRKYYSDLGIKNMYSTPAYLQGNGQAEAVNKVIMNGLKKRLDDAK